MELLLLQLLQQLLLLQLLQQLLLLLLQLLQLLLYILCLFNTVCRQVMPDLTKVPQSVSQHGQLSHPSLRGR